MVVRLGPRGAQKMKIFKVSVFKFLDEDLCRACPEVSETGLGSKIGQRQPENERDALRQLSANPAVLFHTTGWTGHTIETTATKR